MLQLKSERDFVLSFAPQSKEFTITVPSSASMGHTAGLCGNTLMQNISDHLHFSASPPTSAVSHHLSPRCLRSGETQRPFFTQRQHQRRPGGVCLGLG